jgi:hypothetical protein
MHKAHHVIKKLILLSALIMPLLACHSQETLDGNYCIKFGMGDTYHCLNFKGKTFKMERGADLGNDYYGKGTYQIKDSLLILNYNKTPLKEFSGYYRSQVWKNSSDTVQLTFTIRDLEKNPVPYSSVVILKEKIGKKTNKEGKAELKSLKSKIQKEIQVLCLGYEIIKIQIFGNLNYHFDVFLKESDQEGIPIKNQIDTLQIKEFGKGYFIVLNKGKEILWKKVKQ